jgi:effector-binding domain-containing protein
MAADVVVEVVGARPLAAVRRRVRIGEVGAAWRPALDLVWAFLRTRPGLRTDGHNVFLYHHPARREDPMDVDFGVEVVGPFEAAGEVVPRSTPAGRVARTHHHGPIDGLRAAHDAIHAWAAANGERFGGASWEIYGDPTDDPSVHDMEIVYLLAT